MSANNKQVELNWSTVKNTKGYNEDEIEGDTNEWILLNREVTEKDFPENNFIVKGNDPLYYEKIEFLRKKHVMLDWFFKDYFG